MSHQYNLPYLDSDFSEILIPNTFVPQQAVEYINSYIDNAKSEKFSVDISFMNVIDACYVSTLCSTNHFIKFPQGEINWFVSSGFIENNTKNLLLGNSRYFQR